MPRSLRPRRIAAALAAVMLVASCVTPAPPLSTPGDRARYDEDLAACRARVASIDTLRRTLDSVVEAALVTAFVLWGLGRSADGVRDGTALGGLLGGASEGLRALEQRQQAERGCMAARGHNGPLPTALATPAPIPMPPVAMPLTLPPPGADTFNAERLARTQACGAAAQAALVASGPGFEMYSVACANGDALAIRCEFGNCRVLR